MFVDLLFIDEGLNPHSHLHLFLDKMLPTPYRMIVSCFYTVLMFISYKK